MMKNILPHIRSLRTDYTAKILDERSVSKNPLIQFEKWIQEAIDLKTFEPNAMTLATSDKKNVDARVLLLRGFDSKGFTFFTNYNSIKGREIRSNKKGCLNFFWPELQRQVRIKGTIEKTTEKISDQYFSTRPRESQIAAWASQQSEKLIDRKELEQRFKLIEEKFKDKKVPRPPHWGGYRLKPVYIEFWQGRSNRLHDRIIYEKKNNLKWVIKRLNP